MEEERGPAFIELVAGSGLEAGAEVFISYGDSHTPDETLAHYGFVEPVASAARRTGSSHACSAPRTCPMVPNDSVLLRRACVVTFGLYAYVAGIAWAALAACNCRSALVIAVPPSIYRHCVAARSVAKSCWKS